jgi:hypothetical protein
LRVRFPLGHAGGLPASLWLESPNIRPRKDGADGSPGVDDIDGALLPVRFVLHDRQSKFCASFRDTLRSAGVQPLSLPARSPNLNAFAERWVRSIKSECLSKLILFGELSCAEQSLNSSSITSTLHNAHLAMLLKSRWRLERQRLIWSFGAVYVFAREECRDGCVARSPVHVSSGFPFP